MNRLFIVVFACLSFNLHANTYPLPQHGNVVGQTKFTYPKAGETLSDIGIRYDLGYQEMVKANSHVDPIRPLSPNTKITLPSRFTLPDVPRTGIVISLKEYRLYYFPTKAKVVMTFPVGIGRLGWDTPIGETNIISKERDPVWRPTANVRREAAKNGTPIPDVFVAGPENPLGRFVLRLGWPTYLIHSTNRVDVVGTRVSAGCIRVMPKDIEQIFDSMEIGTKVRVIV